MPSHMMAVIYDAVTKIVRRHVIPDWDDQLQDRSYLALQPGEMMVLVPMSTFAVFSRNGAIDVQSYVYGAAP